jgi:3-(3-hydroxy-phenyl)propionate hydroxylase
MKEMQHTPVLIVGSGPVGATIANLLGQYGVAALIVDRSDTILDYPRAVGLDDEAMRTFQAAGVAEGIAKDLIQNVPMRMYTAKKQCFAEFLPSTKEFGWYRRNLFSQPLGERALREGLAQHPQVELQTGVELVRLEQDAEGVTATLRRSGGSEYVVRAQILIAADGGRSTVREMLKVPYLGKTHPAKWVVIESDHDPLDAPYTALHCEPARPHVCLRLPHGLRRWEFMLFPGEDGEQMLAPEKVQDLLRPHVPDLSQLHVIRARVYTHNSRVAEHFVMGRVCLAGDAAHITPPWIGQGLNAGLRDAFNLAWKVAGVVQGRLRQSVLETYQQERHEHAQAMIDLADQFGAVLSVRSPALAWLRDRVFLALRHLPPVRDYVLQFRFKPMPRFTQGVVLNSGQARQDNAVGRMFIQPLVEADRKTMPLDDALGIGFTLLGWRHNALQDTPPKLRRKLTELGCVNVVGVRSRSGEREIAQAVAGPEATVLQDHENALQLWFQKHDVDWVLLRPDRYVAAAGRAGGSVVPLNTLLQQLTPDATTAGTPIATPLVDRQRFAA